MERGKSIRRAAVRPGFYLQSIASGLENEVALFRFSNFCPFHTRLTVKKRTRRFDAVLERIKLKGIHTKRFHGKERELCSPVCKSPGENSRARIACLQFMVEL